LSASLTSPAGTAGEIHKDCTSGDWVAGIVSVADAVCVSMMIGLLAFSISTGVPHTGAQLIKLAASRAAQKMDEFFIGSRW
jgi:hypothetical protein